MPAISGVLPSVSTHSRLKAAGPAPRTAYARPKPVSTHSRLKAAGIEQANYDGSDGVSTHSRLKAAGSRRRPAHENRRGFNTQPPKGGWFRQIVVAQFV